MPRSATWCTGGHLLGGLWFGAAAWKVAARDTFIGWSPAQRQSRIRLVVNNAQMSAIWHRASSPRPPVASPRIGPPAYRAANWTCVGQTQGRRKLDRHHLRDKPIKDVYLYLLHRRFRDHLCSL